MDLSEETLIGDVMEVIDAAKRAEHRFSIKTLARIDLYGETRNVFEKHRKTNPLVEDVLQGKTSFEKTVQELIGLKGRAFYPHLRNKNGAYDLKYVEASVGSIEEDNAMNLFGNPVGLGSLSIMYPALMSLFAGAFKSGSKKMARRDFLKVYFHNYGPIIGANSIVGGGASLFKLSQYIDAEGNAKLLDYLANKLYR